MVPFAVKVVVKPEHNKVLLGTIVTVGVVLTVILKTAVFVQPEEPDVPNTV